MLNMQSNETWELSPLITNPANRGKVLFKSAHIKHQGAVLVPLLYAEMINN